MDDADATPDPAAAERGRLLVADAMRQVSAPLPLQARVAEEVARAKGGAPAEPRDGPRALAAGREGVAFPNWERMGWSATDAGGGEAADRGVRTVAYRSDRTGAVVTYSIVAGDALDVPGGAEQVDRDGVAYRLTTEGPRRIVSWERDGHTCVLSAPRTVPDATLLELASWG